MENSAFSFISASCNGDNRGKIGTYHAEKRLKLFGIELHTISHTHKENNEECDESVNSSSSSTISSSGRALGEKISKESSSTLETTAPPGEETIKFLCQYCKKGYPNSQALGGHQNAHKKERMKKKRLQLQATKASINYYLQPYKSNPSYNYHVSSPWAPEFTMYDESQISFSQRDQGNISFAQQGTNRFTLTLIERRTDAKPQVLVTPFQFTSSIKKSKSLDLRLGLSLSQM